jgi:hypothetical protein
MLDVCAGVAPSVATFTNALELFHQGASAIAVHTALSKYQKFKTALPPPPKPEFAMPAPPALKQSMLQKRRADEEPVAAQPSPLKKQKKQSTISFVNASTKKKELEEEKTAAGCFANHGARIEAV